MPAASSACGVRGGTSDNLAEKLMVAAWMMMMMMAVMIVVFSNFRTSLNGSPEITGKKSVPTQENKHRT